MNADHRRYLEAIATSDELDGELDATTAVMIQAIRCNPEEAARYSLTTAAIGPDALTARHFSTRLEPRGNAVCGLALTLVWSAKQLRGEVSCEATQ